MTSYQFYRRYRPKMDPSSPLDNVTVVDVYDYASSIGKEFENLIENYGVDAISNLMPKVIRILEHLEALAQNSERENIEVNDLRIAVEKLQVEKTERAGERTRYEKELEQIEEVWRTEAKDLLKMVSKLQEENRKLMSALSEKDKQAAHTECRSGFYQTYTNSRKSSLLAVVNVLFVTAQAEQIVVLGKLKETIDKQRDEIRSLKRDLSQKNVDCEAIQSQADRLTKLNSEMRRKYSVTSRQAKHLIEEKADLQSQVQEKDHELVKIKGKLGEDGVVKSPMPAAELEKLEERLSAEGKILIDMKDPNRPRFTLSELREVLLERNELKSKLIELEEELELYRPKEVFASDYGSNEELPVQGPINKEPYEKLNPDEKESGIRKFFKFLRNSSSR
ncbi:RILP-like protein 1 isoform X2 [Tubulanus polymorphus]|uniref:RILP-like protein 1 isoform X2 n=1 Tax=Tubulanus polymorphus TaxID=672921 RepID=UPI003DA36DC5